MKTINDSTSNDKEEEDTSKEGNPTPTKMKKEGRRDEMNIENDMKDEWIIEFIDEESEENYGEMDIRIVSNGFLRIKVDTPFLFQIGELFDGIFSFQTMRLSFQLKTTSRRSENDEIDQSALSTTFDYSFSIFKSPSLNSSSIHQSIEIEENDDHSFVISIQEFHHFKNQMNNHNHHFIHLGTMF